MLTQPSAELRRLERLAGSWEAVERWPPSPAHPKGHEAAVRVTARVALKGFLLVQEYEHEIRGVVAYSTLSILRFDDAGNEYVLLVFDSLGTAPQEHRGRFDGDTLTLLGNTTGGGKIRSAITVNKAAAGYSVRAEMAPDGESWIPLMEADYKPTLTLEGS